MKRPWTILYTGLRAPPAPPGSSLIHYPMIMISPKNPESPEIKAAFSRIPICTHLLFTSRTAVKLFFHLTDQSVSHLKILAVGKSTAQEVKNCGYEIASIAKHETAEGVVTMLEEMDLSQSHFFWPHAAGSRPVIRVFFQSGKIPYTECILYDTVAQAPNPKPDLANVDEIFFPSGSCVQAFLHAYGKYPKGKVLTPIGPITRKYIAPAHLTI